MNRPTLIVLFAMAAMTVGVAWWHWPGVWLLLALPVAAATLNLLRGTGRSVVIAGTLALPYSCYATVEVIVQRPSPPGALLTLAASVVLFSVMMPVLRTLARRQH